MSKRKRRLTAKAVNSSLYKPSEPFAPESVNHQLGKIHTPANQKLQNGHVPEETSSFNQNCLLYKNVPWRQRSKGGLQTFATGQERIKPEVPSWSESRPRSRPLTRKTKVIAVTSYSEAMPEQASRCSQLKPRQSSRLRKKSKITDDTSYSEAIPQPASCGSQFKQQPRSRQIKKSKITDDTSYSEVIPQPASCGSQFKQQPRPRQIKRSKITDDTSYSEAITQPASCGSQFKQQPRSQQRKKSKIRDDTNYSEVFPQPGSRCQGQPRRNNNQRGKLGSEKFELYLESIWKWHPEDRRNSFTYLDSLWFSLYSKNSSKVKVLNWITKKKIFSKNYVFVPIVMWSHWNLLIFCHLGESLQSKVRSPCLLLLDSLRMADPERLEPGIRKFVLDIFEAEQRPETKDQIRKIPLMVPKVPQQRNDGDCGNFVLYYINLFLHSAPENFSISKGYPYFMTEDWFTPERLELFWEELESTTKSCSDSDECLSDSGDVVCLDHNQQCQ